MDCGDDSEERDGVEWGWALVELALEITGIWPIMEYVKRNQDAIA